MAQSSTDVQTRFVFTLSVFVSGIAGGIVVPVLGLYLIDGLGVAPMHMGIYLAVATLAGVLSRQVVAHFSDRASDRKIYIYIGFVGIISVNLLYAWTRNYSLLLVFGSVLLAVGGIAFSELFALAREFADQARQGVARFNSILRAQVSIAWILGPPAGFFLVEHVGFSITFVIAAGLNFTALLLVKWMLPDVVRAPNRTAAARQDVPWYRCQGPLLCVASIVLVCAANNAYLVALPLYLSKELIVGAQWAGYMMGFAAAIEVPMMLGFGAVAERLGPKRILVAGIAIGIPFYAGIYLAVAPWQLMALQLLNGALIGAVAGLGMTLIQDMLPRQPGAASALFANAWHVGCLLGSLLVGGIAQIVSYRAVFISAITLCACSAFVMLLAGREPAK